MSLKINNNTRFRSNSPAYDSLAVKQSARPTQAPAPAQSPANFSAVSAEPSHDRRWLFAALALLVWLAGVAALALLVFGQAGPR